MELDNADGSAILKVVDMVFNASDLNNHVAKQDDSVDFAKLSVKVKEVHRLENIVFIYVLKQNVYFRSEDFKVLIDIKLVYYLGKKVVIKIENFEHDYVLSKVENTTTIKVVSNLNFVSGSNSPDILEVVDQTVLNDPAIHSVLETAETEDLGDVLKTTILEKVDHEI